MLNIYKFFILVVLKGSFSFQSQVDGAGDGESDFSDEDADVVDSYSVDTPLLRTGSMSLAHSTTPHCLDQQQTPSVPPTPSQQPLSSLAGHAGPQTVGAFDDEDDDSDDGLVAATPGTFMPPIGSSTFTPNPSSIPLTPLPNPDAVATHTVASASGKRLENFVGPAPEKRSRLSPRGASDLDDGDADVESDPEDYDKRCVWLLCSKYRPLYMVVLPRTITCFWSPANAVYMN